LDRKQTLELCFKLALSQSLRAYASASSSSPSVPLLSFSSPRNAVSLLLDAAIWAKRVELLDTLGPLALLEDAVDELSIATNEQFFQQFIVSRLALLVKVRWPLCTPSQGCRPVSCSVADFALSRGVCFSSCVSPMM
jgi:hypothetical protein